MDPWLRMLDENEDVFISALKQDLKKPVQVIFFLLVGTVSRDIKIFLDIW
jgi:hypothetical protein